MQKAEIQGHFLKTPVLVTEEQELDYKARLVVPPPYLSVLESKATISLAFSSFDLTYY